MGIHTFFRIGSTFGTQACLVVLLAASTVFAGDESVAGKEYWRDESGALHQYQFFKPNCQGWFYVRDTRDATADASRLSDSILVFARDWSYGSDINVSERIGAYGFKLEKQPSRLEGFTKWVGGYGIRSEVSNVNWQWYPGPGVALYELTESQLWCGPTNVSALSATPFFFGPCSPAYAGYQSRWTSFRAMTDMTLTLAGDMVVMMYAPTNDLTKCDIVVRKPAVLALPRHYRTDRYVCPELNAKSVTLDGGTGMYFGSQTKIGEATVTIPIVGTVQTGIGCDPLIDPIRVAPTLNLKGDATLTATETTTVSGGVTIAAIDGTASVLSGAYSFADDRTVIRVEAGATLALTAADLAGTGKVTLAGAGKLVLSCPERFFLPGRFAFDPAAALAIDVVSGSCIFGKGAELPTGVTVETHETGKVLFINSEGFDFNTRFGGTKALLDDGKGSLIVTDRARENETLNLGPSQVLCVYGSGLKESSKVVMAGGTTGTEPTIRFYATAEIAADIESTERVIFTTIGGGVVGTFSGTYEAKTVPADVSTVNIKPVSGDKLVIAGSWTLGVNNPTGGWRDFLRFEGGDLEITGTLTTKSTASLGRGRVLVHDGGSWSLTSPYEHLQMENLTGPVCLEVGVGGVVQVASGNTSCYLGGSSVSTAKILLTGGTYQHKQDSFELRANGVIELRSGTFKTGRRITVKDKTDTSRIILGGGCFKALAGSYIESLCDDGVSGGGGHTTVAVTGNPEIDLSEANNADFPDCPTGSEVVTWTCEEGAVLSVRGKAAGTSVFTLRDFQANGLTFDLAPNKVVVALENPSDPISLGWKVPGASGSKVSASGSSPNLVASYVVPAGERLDVGNFPTAWYEGFALSATANLTFAEGSEIRFPCFGERAVPTVAGKVTFPSAMNFSVDCTGPRKTVKDVTVFSAAEMSGTSCSWTCVGGVRTDRASVAVDGNSLEFSYNAPGVLMMVR